MKSLTWETENAEIVVDRDEDADLILEDIQNNMQNRIHILYSKTAIGKSSLVTKVLDKYDGLKYHVIRIKTIPNNTADDSAWEFLEEIFKGISEYFEKLDTDPLYELKFSEYIRFGNDLQNQKSKLEKSSNYFFTGDDKKGFIKRGLHILFKYVFSIDEFDPEKVIYSETLESRRIKSNYIKMVMGKCPLLLAIDNLQNIDRYSLKCIREWFLGCPDGNHYFLFEYTFNEIGDKYGLNNLIDVLSPYVNITTCEIPATDACYIIDIINRRIDEIPEDLEFSINILNHYSKVSNGNIKEIKDYCITYKKEYQSSKSELENGTLRNIKEASYPNGQYILALIILLGGSISIHLLKKLCADNFPLKRELEDLNEKNLIISFQQNIELDHASIADQWKHNIQYFQNIENLAYTNLKHYFLADLKGRDIEKRNTAWRVLLKLYSQKEPFLIKDLLPILEEHIISSVSTEKAWDYIYEGFLSLKSNPLEYKVILYKMLGICFRLELYSEGYEIIEFLEDFSSFNSDMMFILHKLLFLVAIDQHDKAISIYESVKNDFNMHTRMGLNLMLTVLCSYRYAGRLDLCMEIHRTIFKDSKYKKYLEYGYFLRLTNIYLHNRKAISFARKSIKFFHHLCDSYQEGKSLITYAKLLAGLGQYKKALRELSKASLLLKNSNIRNNVLWVNEAAILLMQGIHTNYVWELLCKSEYTAVISYDKLAIVVVKLAWCYENKDFSNVDSLIIEGEKLILQEPDLHIHALFYYNVYAICLLRKDNHTAREYYQRVLNLKNQSRYVRARFEGPKTKEEAERLKHPWFICYLSFWNHDVYYFED